MLPRSATRLPLLRGNWGPAPRPLTAFRGILLSPLGPPVVTCPRDFRARLLQAPRPPTFLRGILLPPLGPQVAPFPRDSKPGSPTANSSPRDFASTARPTGRPLSEGFPSPAPPGSPTAYVFPRDFAFTAWLTGRPFSEGFSSPAPPGSPTAYMSPRDFAFTARPTGRPFSEGLRARHRQAPRPLANFRAILLSPLGLPVTSSPRDFRARHRQAPQPLTFLRGISEPGSSRLPDRLRCSEGFCFHLFGRPAATCPREFRARLRQAPRPLTIFRGILLSSLGSPFTTFPRKSTPPYRSRWR